MSERLKTFSIYAATAVVSFFIGLFVLDQIILPQIAVGGAVVEVPDLQGMDVDRATAKLGELELGLTVHGEAYSPEYPAGSVIRQDPDPGVMVKQGRDVHVIRSLGPEIVRVPHIVGLTERQAKILVERARLVVDTVLFESDAEVVRGRVVGIDPPVGTDLAKGSSVTMTVSRGTSKIRVPSVIDRTHEEALSILGAAGLEVGEVTYRFSRYLPPGRVIDQQPIERTAVEKGTAVDLVISKSTE